MLAMKTEKKPKKQQSPTQTLPLQQGKDSMNANCI